MLEAGKNCSLLYKDLLEQVAMVRSTTTSQQLVDSLRFLAQFTLHLSEYICDNTVFVMFSVSVDAAHCYIRMIFCCVALFQFDTILPAVLHVPIRYCIACS